MCHIILLLPILALPVFFLLPIEEAAFVYAGICVLSATLYWLVWRAMRRPPRTGIEGMMGGVGTVFLSGGEKPKLFYQGEIWDVVSNEALSRGEQVEIVGFDRMKLIVRHRVARAV